MEENKCDSNSFVNHIIVMVFLVAIILGGTYFIVDKKVSSVGNMDISSVVKSEILKIEYDKVGGKDNYDFMKKSTADQLTKYRKQYGDSGFPTQPQKNNNQVQNNNNGNIGSTTISLDKVKQVTENTYILGNPDAKISFVEYSDLECPFCKKLHEAGTIDQILSTYKDKVNFIFKSFPLDFHANSKKEHEAALCAGELGESKSYYKYITTIFQRTTSNGRGFSLDALVPLAKELGLSVSKFKTCLNSGKYASRVQKEINEGQSFNVTGTPGNVIINKSTGEYKLLPGAYPFANFKTIIDGFLNK